MAGVPLPASCNWECCDIASFSESGVVAYGARDMVHFAKCEGGTLKVTDWVFKAGQRVSCVCFVKGTDVLAVGCTNGMLCFYSTVEKIAVHTVVLQHALKTLDSYQGTAVCGDYAGCVSTYLVTEGKVVAGSAFTPLKGELSVLRVRDSDCIALGYFSGRVSITNGKGVVQCSMTHHNEAVQCLAWCPVLGNQNTSLLVSAAKDQRIVVWGVNHVGDTLQRLKQLLIPSNWVSRKSAFNEQRFMPLAFSSGYLVACLSTSGKTVAYDLSPLMHIATDPAQCQAAKPMFSILSNSKQTAYYCLVPVGDHVAVFSRDRVIRVLAVSETEEDGVKKLCGTVSGTVQCLGGPGFCMSRNNAALVTGCGDGSLVVRPLRGGNVELVQAGKGRVTAVACHPHKPFAFVYGMCNGSIHMTDKPEKKWTTHTFKTPHRAPVYALAWSTGVWSGPGAAIYSISGGGMVFEHCANAPTRPATNITTKIWHLKRAALADLPELLESIGKHHHSAVHIGHHLTTESKTDAEGKRTQPPRLLFVGGKDGTLDVWLVKMPYMRSHGIQPTLAHTYKYHTEQINNMALRTGTCVAASCASDGYIKIIDVSALVGDATSLRQITGTALVSEGRHAAPVLTIRWCEAKPNVLASASYDNTAQVWELTDGGLVPLTSYRGHCGKVYSLAWVEEAGQSLLYTCSDDGTVRLTDHSHRPHAEQQTAPPEEVAKEQRKRKHDEAPEGAKRAKRDELAVSACAWYEQYKASKTSPSTICTGEPNTYSALKMLATSNLNKSSKLDLGDLPDGASPLDLVASLVAKNDACGVAALPMLGSAQCTEMLCALSGARPGMPLYSACCLVAADKAGDACKLLSEHGMLAEAAIVAHSHAKGCSPEQRKQLLGSIFDRQTAQQSVSQVILGKVMSGDYGTALHLLSQDPSLQNAKLSCLLAELRCKEEDTDQRVAYLNEMRNQYAAQALSDDMHAAPVFHGVGTAEPHPLVLAAVAVQYYLESDSADPPLHEAEGRGFTLSSARIALAHLWKHRGQYTRRQTSTCLRPRTKVDVTAQTALRLAVCFIFSLLGEADALNVAVLYVMVKCAPAVRQALKERKHIPPVHVVGSKALTTFADNVNSFREGKGEVDGGSGELDEELTSLLAKAIQ